jgi:hypothetical protein
LFQRVLTTRLHPFAPPAGIADRFRHFRDPPTQSAAPLLVRGPVDASFATSGLESRHPVRRMASVEWCDRCYINISTQLAPARGSSRHTNESVPIRTAISGFAR